MFGLLPFSEQCYCLPFPPPSLTRRAFNGHDGISELYIRYSACTFEKLHSALVLFRLHAGLEGSEVSAPTRPRVLLPRIEPILTRP
jgi:hypothetical protein